MNNNIKSGTSELADSQLGRLLVLAEDREPIQTAIVHPCDALSLGGALEAFRMRLILPVLVRPPMKIAAVAAGAGEDLTGIRIVAVEHSHAAAAAACRLARTGEVDAVMKGSLHTDELLAAAVDREAGLRTDRRMSHVFILDVPTNPRPLFLSDAAINIAPDLATKKDIVQNAIDCAHALGVIEPRVAILAAHTDDHDTWPPAPVADPKSGR